MRYILSLFVFFIVGTAQATPIAWTVNNAVFDDGTSLTGGFTYDESTTSFTDITLTTQATSFIVGSSYSSLTSTGIGPASQTAQGLSLNLFNRGGLNIVFSALLTDLGGVVSLGTSTREGCNIGSPFGGQDCNGFGQLHANRFLVSGEVSAEAEIPVPSTVWLFGSALIGLRQIRRKTRA